MTLGYSKFESNKTFPLLLIYFFIVFNSIHQSDGQFIFAGQRYLSVVAGTFFLFFYFLRKEKDILLPGITYLFLDIIIRGLFSLHGNPLIIFSLHKIISLFDISLLFLLLVLTTDQISNKWSMYLTKWLPLLFLIFVNSFYSIFSFSPIDPNDPSRHISSALEIFNIISSDESDKFLSALTYYDFYLPLSYLVSIPVFIVFGKSFTSGCLGLSLIWLPIAYHFLWKTLRISFKLNHWNSSLSCLLIIGLPMSGSLIKNYMQDFPAFAMLVVYQYMFLKTQFFFRRKETIFSGLIFGLGLLTKANFFIFGISSLVYSIISIKSKDCFKITSINLLFFFFSLCIPACIWFSFNIPHFAFEINNGVRVYGENNFPPLFSSESLLWYFPRLVNSLGLFQFLLVILLVVTLLSNKYLEDFRTRYFIISFLLFYIIIHFFRVKDQRTLFPALALLAPLIGLGIDRIERFSFPVLYPFVLFFIIQENIYLLTGESKILPKSLLNEPYAISAGFQTADADNQNQAQYIYSRMCRENGLTEDKINWNGGSTEYCNRYYRVLYNNEGKIDRPIKQRKLLFFRDSKWPDYYLFSMENIDSSIIFRLEDKEARIMGDFSLKFQTVRNDGTILNDTTINSITYSPILILKQPSKESKLLLSFLVHHSHPMGQRVKFYYQLLGKPYDNFNNPLEVYLPNGSRNSQVEIRM
jgi:hypothetical protein